MPSSTLSFSHPKFKNKMAAKIYITLHHDLANDEHKKHQNKIFGVPEFSYVAPAGHIATTIKQWQLNLITIIVVTHQVLIGNFFKVDFGAIKIMILIEKNRERLNLGNRILNP